MSLNLIDQATQRKRIDDLLANPVESAKELESLRQQLASRDAEIADLLMQANKYDLLWVQSRKERDDAINSMRIALEVQHIRESERDQLRKDVKLLRDALGDFDKAAINSKSIIEFAGKSFKLLTKMRKALAATEHKE